MSELHEQIRGIIEGEDVALFMKGTPQFAMCGNSQRALDALRRAGAPVTAVDILPDPGSARSSRRSPAGRRSRRCSCAASSWAARTSSRSCRSRGSSSGRSRRSWAPATGIAQVRASRPSPRAERLLSLEAARRLAVARQHLDGAPRPAPATWGNPTPASGEPLRRESPRERTRVGDTLLSDQVGGSSRRSKARDSARRSVTGFCSESARVRSTARSLRVEDEPAPASALPRSSPTTVSSRASFRPFRSKSIMAARTPTRLYSSERRLKLIGSYRHTASTGPRVCAATRR